MSVHYVDKDAFLKDIREYRARKETNPNEPIPEYSARALVQIANKLANRPNFIGYSFRDEMISDAIYVCLKYFDKFDPNNPKGNPFGYFTQCMWFAFLQRIAKEKKQSDLKGKLLSKRAIETFAFQDVDNDEEFKNNFIEFLRDHNYEICGYDIKPSEVTLIKSAENPIIDTIIEEMIEEVNEESDYKEDNI